VISGRPTWSEQPVYALHEGGADAADRRQSHAPIAILGIEPDPAPQSPLTWPPPVG
jgi:hypothetical protein